MKSTKSLSIIVAIMSSIIALFVNIWTDKSTFFYEKPLKNELGYTQGLAQATLFPCTGKCTPSLQLSIGTGSELKFYDTILYPKDIRELHKRTVKVGWYLPKTNDRFSNNRKIFELSVDNQPQYNL